MRRETRCEERRDGKEEEGRRRMRDSKRIKSEKFSQWFGNDLHILTKNENTKVGAERLETESQIYGTQKSRRNTVTRPARGTKARTVSSPRGPDGHRCSILGVGF